MTDQEFEELKANEKQLWTELSKLEKPYQAKTSEWLAVRRSIKAETHKRALLAELVAEGRIPSVESVPSVVPAC